MASQSPVAVIDLGSGLVKAGFQGQAINVTAKELPDPPRCRHVFHTAMCPGNVAAANGCLCCAYPLAHSHLRNSESDFTVCPTYLQQPISRGAIRDLGHTQLILEHTVKHELQCHVPTTPLLLTGKFVSGDISTFAPLFEIAFEALGHPTVALAPTAPLVLMSRGHLNGIVLDVGHGSTTVTAVQNGQVVPGSCNSVPLGGIDITSELFRTVSAARNERGVAATPNYRLYERIKEDHGSFARKRGLTATLWSVRKHVLERRHATTLAFQRNCHTLRQLQPRDQKELLRYLFAYDAQLRPPSNLRPRTWELPDGTSLELGPELESCADVLWTNAQVTSPLKGVGAPSRKASAPEERGQLADNEDASWNERSIPPRPWMNRTRQKPLHSDRNDSALAAANKGRQRKMACEDIVTAFSETCHTLSENPEMLEAMVRRVFIAGGTTLQAGFLDRCRFELRSGLSPALYEQMRLIAEPDRLTSTWCGASILASTSFRESTLMLDAATYEEYGVESLRRRWHWW